MEISTLIRRDYI